MLFFGKVKSLDNIIFNISLRLTFNTPNEWKNVILYDNNVKFNPVYLLDFVCLFVCFVKVSRHVMHYIESCAVIESIKND